jgi:glutathione-regulated potassium-efflux system ancillary protein KefC/glutathione-regulated potassium-efflux system protein KefB
MNPSWLQQAVVFLAAAVIAVPLFTRLGVGAVLGYLTAGIVIGPWLLGFVSDVETILHFAELGVVLLLFVIGLELRPSRLWALRHPVFGLGSAQVVVTGLVLSGAGVALGLPPVAAFMAGFSLSLSSTALVLQLLAEKNQLTTQHGRASFAVLLFQDLAALPLLAIFPLLGRGGANPDAGWTDAVEAIAMVLAVIAIGRWLLRPYLRLAASARVHDIFIAAGLLVPVGTALLMAQVGLSMALGAFIAGVLLADSEYRHALEADIEPFKGLLLGLFFIAVGMSVDLGLVVDRPLVILGLTLGLVATKAVVAYALVRLTRYPHATAVNVALSISQGGEFAFILFGVAAGAGGLDKPLADMLTVVVSLSMALTPLIVTANDKWLRLGKAAETPTFEPIDPQDHRVIIAGFGRFGQMIARTLRMKKIPFTALEASFEQVDFVRKFGNRIHYGDASRLELLRAARADLAEVFVLAIDDVDVSVKTAEIVRKHYPHLKIYARARNRIHAYRLMDLGVDKVMRETFLSSVELARDILVGLGHSIADADAAAHLFRRHDEELLVRQHAIYDDEAQLIAAARAGAAELERLFEQDTETDDAGR